MDKTSDLIIWAQNKQNKYIADELFDDFCNCIKNGKDYREHPLIKLLDKYTINDDKQRFFKKIKKGTIVYRARIVNDFDFQKYHDFDSGSFWIHGYNESNSREAPLGISPIGRNNIGGVSYLYVSKDDKTACVEVKSSPRDLLSLASFEITTSLNIIDFAYNKAFNAEEVNEEGLSLGQLFTRIMKSYITPVQNNEEYKIYRITQILTDHIRKTGVDGISYGSYYDRQGVNYTIFNSHKNYIRFIGSRLVVNQSQRVTFLDFENEKTISVYSKNDSKYDKDNADYLMQAIKYKIISQAKKTDID